MDRFSLSFFAFGYIVPYRLEPQNATLEAKAAKQQGQSLQATMQTLERFYAEGLLGEIEQTSEAQAEVIAAWQRQLERLWNEG